nr:WYL domain-containing protein [Amycolatopsis sp. M39]
MPVSASTASRSSKLGEIGPDGRLRPEAAFQDSRHAERTLRQLATAAEVFAPQALRAALHQRATAIAAARAGPA